MSTTEPLIEHDQSVSAFHWRKARGVMTMVKVRRNALLWSQDTKLMSASDLRLKSLAVAKET